VVARARARRPSASGAIFDRSAINGLHEAVALAVEQAIFLGTLAPGARLVEADIAEQFGISKAPVREALRDLEQLGLVVSHPRRGSFVTTMTATLASEVFSLRAMLESYAARIAIDAFAETDFDRMAELARLADASNDDVQQIDYDLQIHDILFDVADHRLLFQMWSQLRSQARLFLTVSGVLRAAERRETGYPSFTCTHLPIVAALRSRDAAQAEAAIVGHLAAGERLLLNKLSCGQEEAYIRPSVFDNLAIAST
jgi:DNA-binding GntR family transcriptional regulator